MKSGTVFIKIFWWLSNSKRVAVSHINNFKRKTKNKLSTLKDCINVYEKWTASAVISFVLQ